MPRLSENAISFFGAGGHKHDGVSSTLISTDKYSLFDFNPGYRGSQSRITIQQANQAALEEWVMNLVNTKVLAPAGLDLAPGILSGKTIRANTITATELQANTITADEIAANAVTANELAANLVLVNNVIRSNNYNGTIAANGAITANGNAGWAITSFGSAEFANAVIRGNVTANAGSIGGWNVDSNSLYSGTKSSNGNYATSGITIGSSGFISAKEFRLDADGNAYFKGDLNGANIVGVTGRFTGNVTVDGDLTAGNTTIYANGQITNGGYTLSSIGVLTATGANIAGTVTATDGGQIGDFFITSGALSASSLSDAIAGTSASMSLGVDGLIKTRIDVGSVFGTPYYTETYINRRESAGGIYIIGTASGSTAATEITSSFISTGTVFINGNSVATSLAGKSNTGHTHAYAADDHLHDSRYVNADGDSMTGALNINSGSLTNVMQARRTYAAGANFIQFVNDGTGNAIGAVEFASATTVNYKTSSDKRLKENITDIVGAFDLIKRINPVEYNFISEGPLHRVHGFLAQDLYEQYPYPVCVGSDDLKENPWGIDYGKMTPLLTAALKEAIAKIEEMEARIQTLEGV